MHAHGFSVAHKNGLVTISFHGGDDVQVDIPAQDIPELMAVLDAAHEDSLLEFDVDFVDPMEGCREITRMTAELFHR